MLRSLFWVQKPARSITTIIVVKVAGCVKRPVGTVLVFAIVAMGLIVLSVFSFFWEVAELLTDVRLACLIRREPS